MRTKEDLLKRRAELSPAKRALLEKHLRGESAPQVVASTTIPKRPEGQIVPVSYAQERFWFLQQLVPGTAAYNEPDAARLRGPLDMPAMTRAVQEIMRRHEVLRSTYKVIDGHVWQVIDQSAHLHMTLPVLDLR